MPDQREKYRNFEFPQLGLDVSLPSFDQRPNTSPLAINVRAYDGSTDRLRGGSRQGLTPFLGAGSTEQVSGFNRIQSLSCIVTTDQAATFNTTYAPIIIRLHYSETDNPPVRNAPTNDVPEKWYQDTKPLFTALSAVIVGTPDGGGTGQGEATFKIETDGTTVTLTATFQTAGFPGPYFYSGPAQVQTMTLTFNQFFVSLTGFTGSWTVVSGGFIAILTFNVFYNP